MTSSADEPRLTRRQKMLRYLANTGLSFGVNLGTAWLLHDGLGFGEELAYAVSLSTVFTMNFFLFRYYVFDGRSETPGRQVALYLGTSVAFRAVEYLGFLVFHSWLGMYYLLAIVVVQGGTFVLKYFVYGGLIFKRTANVSVESTEAEPSKKKGLGEVGRAKSS